MKKEELQQNAEEKILNAATTVFAKNGFEGASVRDICRIAGVNVSMVSYYFGGKKGLYERIVTRIVQNIIRYMKNAMGIDTLPESFSNFPKKEKTDFLFRALGNMIDYFYSEKISDDEILIFSREQITSGIALDATGYKLFKKLLASILDKDEEDKEVIFRCSSIVGQIHSARLYKQFSLKMMNQQQYSHEDNILFKNIVISQIKAILKDLGALNEK